MLEKTKSYKIDVTELTIPERVKLQKKLFNIGYTWARGEKFPQYLGENFLYIDNKSSITCGNNRDYFEKHEYDKLNLQSIIQKPEPELVKPPLGLVPRRIHNENRVSDIKQAVNRMFDADSCVDVAWIEEYNELCAMLKKE